MAYRTLTPRRTLAAALIAAGCSAGPAADSIKAVPSGSPENHAQPQAREAAQPAGPAGLYRCSPTQVAAPPAPTDAR